MSFKRLSLVIICLGLAACAGPSADSVEETRAFEAQPTAAPPTANALQPAPTKAATKSATAVPTAKPAPTAVPPVPTAVEGADSSKPAPSTETESGFTSDGSGVIEFKREGGFAGLSETWTIYEDGRFLNPQGVEYKADHQLAASVFNEVVGLGFFDLGPEYLDANHCCDFFAFEVTVTYGGRSHTVKTMESTPSMPDSLNNMLFSINFAVNSPPES